MSISSCFAPTHFADCNCTGASCNLHHNVHKPQDRAFLRSTIQVALQHKCGLHFNTGISASCLFAGSGQPRPNNRAMRRRPGRLQSAHEESCCQDPIIPHAKSCPTSDNIPVSPVHPTSASVSPASAQGHSAEHQLYSAQLEPHVTQPDSTTTQPASSLTQLQSRTAQPSSLHSASPNQGPTATQQQTVGPPSQHQPDKHDKVADPQQQTTRRQKRRAGQHADASMDQLQKKLKMQAPADHKKQDRSLETHLWHAKRM